MYIDIHIDMQINIFIERYVYSIYGKSIHLFISVVVCIYIDSYHMHVYRYVSINILKDKYIEGAINDNIHSILIQSFGH